MASTLREWILIGFGDEAGRRAFAAACASSREQLLVPFGIVCGGRKYNPLRFFFDVSLQVSPQLPLAMLNHFPSVLARWPAASALASPAEPYADLVTAALALASMNSTGARAGGGQYWMTLLLAVQTVAVRLRLPLHTFGIHPGSEVFGSFGYIGFKIGQISDFCYPIQISTYAQLEECLRELGIGEKRDAATSTPNAETAPPPALTDVRKLMDNVRSFYFCLTLCLLLHQP
jgi:hypothetical protein